MTQTFFKDMQNSEMKKVRKFGSGFVAGGFICAFVLTLFFPALSLTLTPAIEVGATMIAGFVTGATSAVA